MKDHPVIHFEIGCHGGEKTREFFAQLFGWEISGRDQGMIVNTGGAGGIGGHIVELAPEWGTYVTIYFHQPGIQDWWQVRRGAYSQPFCEFLETSARPAHDIKTTEQLLTPKSRAVDPGEAAV